MIDTENSLEQYANWVAPDGSEAHDSPDAKGTIADFRKARQKQSHASRLCEFITGLKPEDPAMIERLALDCDIIRGKYQLPPRDMPPSERERALQAMAKELGVRVVPTHETGSFFKENPNAIGVHLDDARIGVDMKRQTLESYRKSVSTLEHEVIHALQEKTAKSMPIELCEYEAYVASANIEFLKTHPDLVKDALFGFYINGSVNTYYREKSTERGAAIVPAWDNPEYFVALDEKRAAEQSSAGVTS